MNPASLFRFSTRLFLSLVVLTVISACSQRSAPSPPDQGSHQLAQISQAYVQHTLKNGKPPESAEDLKPLLPPEAADPSFFQSTRDGRPFIILWGTDPQLDGGASPQPLVIGYEQVGDDGMRYVFTTMGMMSMSDDAFAKANFPPGHTPSQSDP